MDRDHCSRCWRCVSLNRPVQRSRDLTGRPPHRWRLLRLGIRQQLHREDLTERPSPNRVGQGDSGRIILVPTGSSPRSAPALAHPRVLCASSRGSELRSKHFSLRAVTSPCRCSPNWRSVWIGVLRWRCPLSSHLQATPGVAFLRGTSSHGSRNGPPRSRETPAPSHAHSDDSHTSAPA